MDPHRKAFNLYVFQTARDEDVAATVDDVFLRYNVNGIELNAAGFEKLSKEINLKFIECTIPEVHSEAMHLYTGKFPTASGKYQRLVIREAQIPVVNPEDLTVVRMTPRRYYEVCSHPKVYEYVKSIT
jgi:hypothetical protein